MLDSAVGLESIGLESVAIEAGVKMESIAAGERLGWREGHIVEDRLDIKGKRLTCAPTYLLFVFACTQL